MLVCLLGTGLASVVFSVCTNYGLFVTMWAVLRFLQPAGWTAVVQLAGSWVPHTRHGRVMGILSLSFLVGDVFARGVLAVLVARDVSWVVVVLFSGIITMTALIPWYFILKPDPTCVGCRALELLAAHPHARAEARCRHRVCTCPAMLGFHVLPRHPRPTPDRHCTTTSCVKTRMTRMWRALLAK